MTNLRNVVTEMSQDIKLFRLLTAMKLMELIPPISWSDWVQKFHQVSGPLDFYGGGLKNRPPDDPDFSTPGKNWIRHETSFWGHPMPRDILDSDFQSSQRTDKKPGTRTLRCVDPRFVVKFTNLPHHRNRVFFLSFCSNRTVSFHIKEVYTKMWCKV